MPNRDEFKEAFLEAVSAQMGYPGLQLGEGQKFGVEIARLDGHLNTSWEPTLG